MTKDEIENFQEDVRKAHSNLNIIHFTARLGRVVEWQDGEPQDIWVKEMWKRFLAFSSTFSEFDAETLSKILYDKQT